MFFVNDGGKTVHCFTVKQSVFDTVAQWKYQEGGYRHCHRYSAG
jgi:hypothetical protein